MSAAAWSVLAFGVYLAGGGLALILAPALACQVAGLEIYQGPWIRLTGLFFLLFANYCFRAAWTEQRDFMRWTVTTRPMTLVFILALVAAGLASSRLIAFGVIDVIASVWTALALRSDAGVAAAHHRHA